VGRGASAVYLAAALMRECHADWPARVALGRALVVPLLGTTGAIRARGRREVWFATAVALLPPLVSLTLGYFCTAL